MLQLTKSPPCWYWIVALVISVWQGVRGFALRYQLTSMEIASKMGVPGAQTPTQIWIYLAIPDFFTYFLSAGAGFVSLMLLYRILSGVDDTSPRHVDNTSPREISLGTATLIVFLATFGLLGVTGKLPYLLDKLQVFAK